MKSQSATRDLYKLTKLYNIQIAYYDMNHCRQQASADSLLIALNLQGAPVNKLNDVPSAIREYENDFWRRPLEPAYVIWDSIPPTIPIRLPANIEGTTLSGHIELESGETTDISWQIIDLPTIETKERENVRYITKLLPISEKLPWGYHYLIIEIHGKTFKALLISTPVKAYGFNNARFWGVFLPLYSLYRESSWGSGDLSDLEALIDWINSIGGNVVATLPMLPTFLDEPFEPSPYAPVSRLAWNEFYANLDNVNSPISNSSFQNELQTLRKSALVDYRIQMALKRKVLEEISKESTQNNHASQQLQKFSEDHPNIADYANFRAVYERRKESWKSWPGQLREGIITDGDYDPNVRSYYLYTQWLLHMQMEALSQKAKRSGPGLYLDYPLGVHPDGYDVWRHQKLFLHKASAGAPPDPLFTNGQNWGFPPFNSKALRESGYDYYISCLRHHLRHAGILRIDHVMGLHRLFTIPNGLEANHGVYIHYNAEELYAILCLESQRAQSLIIGEDLGTVPPYVRPAMKKHNIYRNYVVQYELYSNNKNSLPQIPKNTIASFNTHDMPPFSSFWQGLDIDHRLKLNFLNNKTVRTEKREREIILHSVIRFLKNKGLSSTQSPIETNRIFKDILRYLSKSQASVVLVNLEDIWLETEPQNIPGITNEYPNWRRKARYSFETFNKMPEVLDILYEVNRIRREGAKDDSK